MRILTSAIDANIHTNRYYVASYNQATSNLAIYSHETSQHKLSEA